MANSTIIKDGVWMLPSTLDSLTTANHHVVTGTSTPTTNDYYLSLGWSGNIAEIYAVKQGVGGVPISLGSRVLIGTTTDDGSTELQVAGAISAGSLGIGANTINTATTNGTAAGQIVYDSSGGANSGHFMGWNGSAWKQLDN